MPHLLEVEAFEDVEHLDHRHAATARRRHGVDIVAPVGAVDGLLFVGLVGGQIFFGDHAAMLAHKRGQQAGCLAFVEAVVAVVTDALERCGQVRLFPGLARRVGDPSVFQKGLPGRGIERIVGLADHAEKSLHGPGGREPLLRQFDGRFEEIGPWQLTQPLMRQVEARHGAGHSYRERPFVVRVVLNLTVWAEVHRGRGRQRCFLAEVERGDGAVGAVVDEKAAPADVARRRQRHGQREGRRHRCIDGVTTFLQNRVAGLRAEVVAADGHPVARRHGNPSTLRPTLRDWGADEEQAKENQPFVVRVVLNLTVWAEVHRGRGRQRCFLAEVERGDGAVGAVVDEKAAPADVARRRQRHGQREGRRHRCIDGVTTFLQNRVAGLRAEVVAADGHPVARRHGNPSTLRPALRDWGADEEQAKENQKDGCFAHGPGEKR